MLVAWLLLPLSRHAPASGPSLRLSLWLPPHFLQVFTELPPSQTDLLKPLESFCSHCLIFFHCPYKIFFFNNYLFIYLFLAVLGLRFVRGLSPVAESGGHSSSRCAGLSLLRPLLLRSTGSRRAGSVAVAHGPSCSAACGIFPDQGSNPCPLH